MPSSTPSTRSSHPPETTRWNAARGRALIAKPHGAHIAALSRLATIVKGMENVRMFADGGRVAVFYDLVTNTPAGTSATAEIYTVSRGRITELQAIFDARPFAAMFAKK